MTIDEVHAALKRLDLRPRKCGVNQWIARCPLPERHANGDRKRSLSVGIGRDGEIGLVHCQAGCSQSDVLAVLRGEVELLSDVPPIPRQKPEPPEPLPSKANLEAWQEALTPAVANALREWRPWSYSTLTAFGLGYDNKRLTLPMYERGEMVNVGTYRPGGKVVGLSGRHKPLYHVPILGTLPKDTPLWIVEGEPDVISAYELGLWAVGVPGVNNWRQEHAQRFTGRSVRVCMDCDRPGREAAVRIWKDLIPYVDQSPGALKVVDLEPLREDGYDLTDFLMDARSRNERDELAEARAYLRWLQEH